MRTSRSQSLAALLLGTTVGLGLSSCLEPVIRVAADGGEGGGGGMNCGAGLLVCENTCIDPRSDEQHCGACDIACAANQTCAGGDCYANDCSVADCSADQVCVDNRCTGTDCVGVLCPAGKVCFKGVCLGPECNGTTCPPEQVCSNGACIDPRCLGVICPPEMTCVLGQCVSGCVAGATCNPGPVCQVGAITCDGGATCTLVASAPAGSACGTDQVCDADGGCVLCAAGSACSPAPCFTGHLDCATGAAVCSGVAALAPGTACGTGLVCAPDAGCFACDAGAWCPTGNECLVGTLSCGTGAEVCVETPAPPGRPCAEGICDGDGGCGGCTPDAACVPENACFSGSIACIDGGSQCTPVAQLDAGSSCGVNKVCAPDAGCADCDAGASCPTGNDCLVGAITCGTGTSVCSTARPVAPGTPCDSGYCDGDGGCASCTPGVACSTGNDCEAAIIDCSLGTPRCVATGPKPSTTLCRAAGADPTCDPAEYCTGTSLTCPANAFASTATACGSADNTDCNAPDSCDGAGACVNRVKPASTVCRAAGADPTCDPAESCTGSSPTCPANAFSSTSTPCGSPDNTACNAPDTCNGSGACAARVKALGEVCRAAVGVCDAPETCNGVVSTCPADAAQPNGTPCPSGVCHNGACCSSNVGQSCWYDNPDTARACQQFAPPQPVGAPVWCDQPGQTYKQSWDCYPDPANCPYANTTSCLVVCTHLYIGTFSCAGACGP